MKNKKKSGSFYTPTIIANFLVQYLATKIEKNVGISVLEPSAGDGVFVRAIYDHETISGRLEKVVAVEKSKRELNKIRKFVTSDFFHPVNSDFLIYQENNREKFSLVIGNPPYIKKNLLLNAQINRCKKIHQNANLSANIPKNIWTAFLVRCIEFTNSSGILAFVLPSELLQVKFASELRELIITKFERIEIFTFNELLFKDCKGQDTLILIAERESKNPGIFYCNINRMSDLNNLGFSLSQNINVKESKWTHHHLNTDEIELLEKFKGQLRKINDYCSSKAGIVTAANDFFIFNSATKREFSLENYTKPIIQKGAFINGSVVITDEEFQLLIDSLKPTYLLVLDKNSRIRKNQRINRYLKIGLQREINKRYKASIREKWFEVPNIGTPPDGFFFKRCNEYPKLIKNSANVLATDSAYIISMNPSYSIESLIFSFYNSLTLALSELHGRYYGGGVLELTPNEFKNLPVPYVEIDNLEFDSYVDRFKEKTSIKEICALNDSHILKSFDKSIDEDSILKLQRIREKLFLRRIKAN